MNDNINRNYNFCTFYIVSDNAKGMWYVCENVQGKVKRECHYSYVYTKVG